MYSVRFIAADLWRGASISSNRLNAPEAESGKVVEWAKLCGRSSVLAGYIKISATALSGDFYDPSKEVGRELLNSETLKQVAGQLSVCLQPCHAVVFIV